MNAWEEYLLSERDLLTARQKLFDSDASIVELVREAILNVTQRGAALRLLRDLDDSLLFDLFDELVELASVGHADIGLVRTLIQKVPAPYLDSYLWDSIEPHLVDTDDEPFRRYAELLAQIERPEELRLLVATARRSSDPHVLEVANDLDI